MAGTGPQLLEDLNHVIQHNLNAEPGEELTGEVHVDSAGQRWPVYKMKKQRKAHRPQRDADGKIMYHLAADGSRRRPMMESYVESEEWVEFIKMPLGNGIVQRNWNFRPTPEELERQRISRENERGMVEFREILAGAGKTVTDVVNAIKDSVGVQNRAETAIEEPGQGEDAPKEENALERYHRLRKQASDMGLDVTGTGKGGAPTADDFEKAIAAAEATTE